jgi:hypothetical protein
VYNKRGASEAKRSEAKRSERLGFVMIF